MVVTLGQQYSVGEKPTVILLYIYTNRHAETPNKKQKQNKNNVVVTMYDNSAIEPYNNRGLYSLRAGLIQPKFFNTC